MAGNALLGGEAGQFVEQGLPAVDEQPAVVFGEHLVRLPAFAFGHLPEGSQFTADVALQLRQFGGKAGHASEPAAAHAAMLLQVPDQRGETAAIAQHVFAPPQRRHLPLPLPTEGQKQQCSGEQPQEQHQGKQGFHE